jgi:hypothetical protein
VFDNNRRYALTFICVCNWDCVHCLASTVCESCVSHFGSLCCTSPLWCGRSQVRQRGGSVVASHPHASRQHPHPVPVPLPGGNCDGQHQQGDTEGHPAARREGASEVPVCTPRMCIHALQETGTSQGSSRRPVKPTCTQHQRWCTSMQRHSLSFASALFHQPHSTFESSLFPRSWLRIPFHSLMCGLWPTTRIPTTTTRPLF